VRGTDYTASTGTSITGLTALVAGDSAVVASPNSFAVANAIPISQFTAKGDILVGTGSGSETALNVGADGSTLVANSSSSTGVAWAGPTFAAGKNKIINGDFGVWQRGTSFTGVANTDVFTADRWVVRGDGSGFTKTITQQAFTVGTAPVAGYESAYFLQYAQTVAGSGATYSVIQQRIEDVRTFAGQTVTISFWAKADATRTVSVSFDRNYGSGGSSTEYAQSSTGAFTLTTSWARYTATVSIASLAGKTVGAGSYLAWTLNNNTLNATSTIGIWGVQLEAGSVATPFSTATGTLQGELAACQRYYVRKTGINNFSIFGGGPAQSSTSSRSTVPLPVQMRVLPSSMDYSTLRLSDGGGFNSSITSLSIQSDTSHTLCMSVTAGVSSGLTYGQYYYIYGDNSASAYIGFSAEL